MTLHNEEIDLFLLDNLKRKIKINKSMFNVLNIKLKKY